QDSVIAPKYTDGKRTDARCVHDRWEMLAVKAARRRLFRNSGVTTRRNRPIEADVPATHADAFPGMFCATRHKTPLGSNKVKSRIAHALSSGLPILIANRSAMPKAVRCACQ